MPSPCCVTFYCNTLTGKCVHARAGGPSCKTSINLRGRHSRPRSCRQHYTSSCLIAQVQELSGGGAVTAGANHVIVFVFCLTNCLTLRRKSDSVNRGFVHQHLCKLMIIDRQGSVEFETRCLFFLHALCFLNSNESSNYTISLLRWLLLLYNISTGLSQFRRGLFRN